MDGRERMLRALRGDPVDHAPVWIAGLGDEAATLPVDALGAVEDVVAPLPTFGRVRVPADVDALETPRRKTDATARLRAAHPDRALVAAAGAPLSLAVTLTGGFTEAKAFAYAHGAAWERLLARCAELAAEYLASHLAAGADVVEVRDRWAERVSPEEFERLVLPATRQLFAQLRGPSIYDALGTAHLLPHLAATGATAWGIDWRVPLEEARARHPSVALVGNLDPTLLLAPEPWLRQEVRWMVEAMPGPGWVAALGGPLLPETSDAALAAFAHTVAGA